MWFFFSRAAPLAALAFLVLGTGSAPFARQVSGYVTDKRGNTLPAAVVQAENTWTLRVRSCVTGKDGAYRFDGLNSEVDFTLRARYRNYWSAPKTISRFNEAKHVEVNLMIPID